MNYTSIGRLKISGISPVCQTEKVSLKFSERDFVFNAEKARKKGVLEELCIKIINLTTVLLNYVDTFNEVYLENELVSEEEAYQLAIIYYQRRITQLELEIEKNATLDKEQELERCQNALASFQSKTTFVPVNPSVVDLVVRCI